jgi:thiamine-monophosphate kinase
VDEFDLIARLLAPLSTGAPGAFGLTNDAATLAVEAGWELVVTKDMMAENVHFLSDDPPDLVARKLLRVNLSDLAAMGARPLGYLIGAGLTRSTGETWLAAFVAGLAADQETYGVSLLGGDTINVGDGPLVLSLTALGKVETGLALTRSGARAGDVLVASGTLGDAALGLKCLRGEIDAVAPIRDALADRYRLPRPRIELGRQLIGRASAALDISDGLVADAGHVAKESGLAIDIDASRLPLSTEARHVLDADPDNLASVLTGGDDYELLFTIAESGLAAIDGGDVPLAVIGRCRPGEGVRVSDGDGRDITPVDGGWHHAVSDT